MKNNNNDKEAFMQEKSLISDELLTLLQKAEKSLENKIDKGCYAVNKSNNCITLCIIAIILSTIISISTLIVLFHTKEYIKLTCLTLIFLSIIALDAAAVKKLLDVFSMDQKRKLERLSTIYKCADKLQELKISNIEYNIKAQNDQTK